MNKSVEKMTSGIIEAYNNAWNSGTTLLSSFIFTLKDRNVHPHFELVKSPASFYSPKIGKTYQTFTAHPRLRSFPKFMREELPHAKQYNFKFFGNPNECDKKGWVVFVKTSRSKGFRRDQMREMFSRLLPKAYGKDFQVYFLMGLPQEEENTTIKDAIDAEMNQHR